MSNKLDEMIEKYRGEDGKLTCASAFKVASKLKTTAMEVGTRAKDNDVRISACDLGQFGKQPLGEFKEEVFTDLEDICDEQQRVYLKMPESWHKNLT